MSEKLNNFYIVTDVKGQTLTRFKKIEVFYF